MDYRVIRALTRRNLYLTFRNVDRLLNLFYWPFLNIVVWGITSTWVQQSAKFDNFLLVFLSVLVFWQITLRSTIDIGKNLLDEVLTKNLINIFISPINLNEWITASIITSVINTSIMVSFSLLMVKLLYSLNIIAALGIYSIPFIISLAISGWSIGFFYAG